jgi:DNA replication protein DnaD
MVGSFDINVVKSALKETSESIKRKVFDAWLGE